MATEKENPNLEKFLRDQEQSAAAQRGDVREDEELVGRHKVDSLDDSEGYRSLDMSCAPMSVFYEPGALIEIRAATTGEIQDYSTVDDNNLYDITMKMNAVLAKCSRLRRPDGSVASYREIKEGDRLFIITEISRLTTSSGNRLQHEVSCPSESCDCVNHIEVSSKSFVLLKPDPTIVSRFFDEEARVFNFKIKALADDPFTLGAPTIGVAQDLYAYMVDRMTKKLKMNVAFMKIIPWMLHDRTSISVKGAEELEFRFTKWHKDKFLAVNAAIGKMAFGIEELEKRCEKCGVEVRTPFTFPGGYSALFIVSNAFEDLIG